jgi:hypothetical protein
MAAKASAEWLIAKAGAVGGDLLTKNQVWSIKVKGLCPKTVARTAERVCPGVG